MLTCVLSLRVSTTPFQTLDTAIAPCWLWTRGSGSLHSMWSSQRPRAGECFMVSRRPVAILVWCQLDEMATHRRISTSAYARAMRCQKELSERKRIIRSQL